MKGIKVFCLLALVMSLSMGSAFARSADIERDQSDAGKMLHKLGRGITNVLTCWVEIPRNIANEWEQTDPATGLVMGTVKGIGWGFTRLATGVYEAVTFPFPIPQGYGPMMEPEFVVTDVWGDHVPDLTDFTSNDPEYPSSAPIYPDRFSF